MVSASHGHPPSTPTAPWLAPDLLPVATLGGQTGVLWKEASPMSLAGISTHLRTQDLDDNSPIQWVEIPGSPRVVHVSEVPELWDSQTSRDLRHLQSAINQNGPLALLAGAACVALLIFGGGALMFLPALYAIQSGEAWIEAAATRRRLTRNPAAYFHARALEMRYAAWIGQHRTWEAWRTWGVAGAWLLLFLFQLFTGFEGSVQKAALVKPLVWEGQAWRLLTGPMLHGSIMHILMNGGAWLSLALLVERTVHRHVLVPVWLLSALGGSLFSVVLMPGQSSVGASGGLMGLVGLLAVMGLRRKSLLPPHFVAGILRSIAMMAVFGILAWAVLDNAAHLGGLLTGATAGLWLFREDEGSLPLPDAALRSGFGWAAIAAFMALFAFTAWQLVGSR
ncbi:MAG: rhomboid family intramembrane serine protease [Acidobacteriota bacterium]|nr:rhomboid family intramembrane serine protease [Acidobacteriota bacterium]